MLDNLIDCDDPIYGRTGILLGASAGGMKAINEYFPSIGEVSEGVILVTGILGAILLVYKIISVRTNIKHRKLEIKQKERELSKDV